ncbi:hypothetical protein ACLB2K_039373 [Fragaria x ananassa]
MQNSNVELHPLGSLLQGCKYLMSKMTDVKLVHIFKESNMTADALAKDSINHDLGLITFQDPPIHVVNAPHAPDRESERELRGERPLVRQRLGSEDGLWPIRWLRVAAEGEVWSAGRSWARWWKSGGFLVPGSWFAGVAERRRWVSSLAGSGDDGCRRGRRKASRRWAGWGRSDRGKAGSRVGGRRLLGWGLGPDLPWSSRGWGWGLVSPSPGVEWSDPWSWLVSGIGKRAASVVSGEVGLCCNLGPGLWASKDTGLSLFGPGSTALCFALFCVVFLF